MPEPILRVQALSKHYPVRGGIFSRVKGVVKAVQEVTFDLHPGETLGLVGESGCGKSTLGRTVMRLEEATDGKVLFDDRDLAHADTKELFTLRRNLQMIFQDPYSSLNPRMTIGEIIREPLDIHHLGSRKDQEQRVVDLLESVGLKGEMTSRYPHEFSGGQRQRVGIARALALNPRIIVADEPVSALDVSVQAQVINLMVGLQKKLGLSYLFISHDLTVVEYISDTIAIMYLGRIVEKGSKEQIFANPRHPYTRALLASAPVTDPLARTASVPLEGEIPSPMNPPAGCAFHPRCPYAKPECRAVVPPLEPAIVGSSHVVACIRKNEI